MNTSMFASRDVIHMWHI